MVKNGDKVSLFHDIGKVGVVIGLRAVELPKREYAVPVSNTWRIIIEWNDGTRTEEKIGDVMRLE